MVIYLQITANKVPPPQTFTPVELMLKFETEKELNTFYALFNLGRVTKAVRLASNATIDCDALRSVIRSVIGCYPNSQNEFDVIYNELG